MITYDELQDSVNTIRRDIECVDSILVGCIGADPNDDAGLEYVIDAYKDALEAINCVASNIRLLLAELAQTNKFAA